MLINFSDVVTSVHCIVNAKVSDQRGLACFLPKNKTRRSERDNVFSRPLCKERFTSKSAAFTRKGELVAVFLIIPIVV
jgi:hypothetical protein